MLISAVIPTFNYGRFVSRAIDSVLRQTYQELECVVVDDGSTDDTPEVLSRYKDRIRVIRKPNGGLSAARNTGIAAARGEVLAFLDADDEWKPEKIAKQAAVLIKQPQVSVVGCGAIVADGQGQISFEINWGSPGQGPEALRGIALRRAWVGGSGSGALVRRSVFDDVGLFDETLNAAEDLDMWLRIGARHSVANLPESLVVIYKHGTGSFRNASKMETAQQRVYATAAQRWPEVFDAQVQRRVRALVATDAGIELADAGKHVAAMGRYLRALRECPLDRQNWKLVARGLLKIGGI